jgi:transglycosylase-like protein with SLT domain/D-alanyl-D-alanine carboxypeptidase-like protein
MSARPASQTLARRSASAGERGQALVLTLGLVAALITGALILAALGQALGAKGGTQRAADLAAVSGGLAMRDAYPRLFEPAYSDDGRPNPRHLTRGRYLALARAAAVRGARRNGLALRRSDIDFPDASSFAPVRIRVLVRRTARLRVPGDRARPRRRLGMKAKATAALIPDAGSNGDAMPGQASGGGYHGPLAYRQGKPMRPDVARAFDRMDRAARADGVTLVIVSAYRSDGEQARLFRQHPDPKWVAPPGKSLHRLGTELDLGPASAYAWLSRNARRFHFIQRYSWERWHYGYTLNAGSRSIGFGRGRSADRGAALPSFVPPRFARAIGRAAQRWNVSAALLAAQLYAESNFNPFAVSPAGARGIAQFMPGTASAYGLRNPFDAEASIDAQAHLMRDLLRRFGSVPLALAAYNAGPGAVAACGCIPPYPETRAYVARILGLLGGAGEIPLTTFTVRLVE